MDTQHGYASRPRPDAVLREQLVRFLTQRLTEELAALWDRHRGRARPQDYPGLAAQVEVVDDVLRVLANGGLPEHHELVTLLIGYRSHADYDPEWTRLV